MPENHSSKKTKSTLKEGRIAIAEKLASTFADYKNEDNEKKFAKSIKKASKILSGSISLTVNGAQKPTNGVKTHKATKKVASKAAAPKKSVAKKSKTE